MTGERKSARAGAQARNLAPYRRYVSVVVLLVVITVLYLWKKVELAKVEKQFSAAQVRIAELQEERAKLAAAIVSRRQPAVIRKLAEERLGMTYPAAEDLKEIVLDHAQVQ